MKGQEIINRIIRDEMPDFEAVRTACHNRASSHHTNTSVRMRWKTAAATVAACLFLTTAVVAAVHYFGSFDRLRGIIGYELAETLTPVETVLSVDEFYVSGFRGELVAVGGIAGNVIDVFLTLEDMVGSRLDNHFEVFAYLSYGQHPQTVFGWSQFSEIIDRTDDGVVTLHIRHIFTHSVSGQELTFGLQSIYYNYRSSKLSLDFDLGTLTEQDPAAWLWNSPILPPHLHDIEVALEGFEAAGGINVSSMGVINGRLHIQEQYNQTAWSRWIGNKVHLIDPYGEVVHPTRGTHDNTATVSFRIDEQGNFYNDRGYNFVVDFPFREFIYDVDITRLSEYRLIAPFSVSDSTTLSWRARFEMEMPYAQELVVTDIYKHLERYGSIISEIRITPLTVLIIARGAEGEERRFGLFEGIGDTFRRAQIQLLTDDGGIIDVSYWGTTFAVDSPNFMERMVISREPIDLDSVVAIQIDDEIIAVRGSD